MSDEPGNGMQWLLTPLEGVQHGSSSIDGMGSACGDCRDCGDCHAEGRMTNDDGPRLRDIIVLILFAILLRIAESFDRDTPGWWREEEE
jgi:hypothetical protein